MEKKLDKLKTICKRIFRRDKSCGIKITREKGGTVHIYHDVVVHGSISSSRVSKISSESPEVQDKSL